MSKTIYITTPCLNCADTIDRTIQSVVTQAGDFFIRYHVQDAGSDDGTLERLAWWQRHVAGKSFPRQCRGIEFSFASQPDRGMYDGLCKGFAAMRIPMDGFMSWINGDDLFMQGAFAFIDAVGMQFSQQQVSWVGGATSIFRNNMPVSGFDNPITRDALRAGLCEGKHWNFLQQEGTFFRKWLWASVKPEQTVAPMRLAGDWNLWRLMAGKASLVQTKMTLAAFRITEGQLSASQRDAYMAEINSILPEADRRAALEALAAPGADLCRRMFRIGYGDGQLTVIDEGRNGMLQHNLGKVFGDASRFALTGNAGQEKTVYTGTLPVPEASPDTCISFENGILAYDRDWQFPAITEQQAFHQVRAAGTVPEGVTYIAYPWANLIDKIQTKASDANVHLAQFHDFCDRLPQDTVLVTVCQHIKMKEFLDLFEQAGISHVFWTHATHEDLALWGGGSLDIRPFPLFPVQIPEASEQVEIAVRPYLFSFIGAKSNQYYLTEARRHILELLREHPRGLIIGRDDWHYNKVVYEHQIRPGARKGNADDLVDKSNSEQFRISLAQSVFSLCPSGSGPNSIRLWESLGAGAIPVVMADTYAPPGDPALWQAAVVFCEETAEAIAALPARLEQIAADPERLRAMQRACAQIWLLYGPQSFVYDVQKLMLELGQGRQAGAPALDPSHGGPRPDNAGTPMLRELLVERMRLLPQLGQPDALSLLRVCAAELLTTGSALLPLYRDDNSPLGQMLTLAQDVLPEGHPALAHYRAVLDYVMHAAPTALAAPAVTDSQGLRIAFLGRHSNRTPLSYPSFQATARGRIHVVDDPAQADVIMTGFNLDLREKAEEFEQAIKASPDTKVMVISEEPLWDSLWSGGFTDTARSASCGDTQLPYTFLNHANSAIFDFERIPYFLLTSDDLLTRYTTLIARNLKLTPQDLLARWRSAPVPAAFVAEKREGDKYALAFPEQEVWGLSSYRSDVAAKMAQMPGVYIEGKGWHSEARRQDLPDWHLDKLAKLDARVRVLSSYENTHQKQYISEKIFDAFVVGGMPTYYAAPSHAIHQLVPEAVMLNSFGLSADAAAEQIRSFEPDLAVAEAWLDTARRLQARFADTQAIRAERVRIVDEILREVSAL
ncbi:exostosin family protein [Citreicella sp. C3M06]|uniref:exostosin domain-containing protein n=1 Tax=Citreicella sp. C3M06 TaxID=2841564 RepID=UPI001C087D03|nr:exostosin family protein [Citreicella sp. C3M06]MBU2963475.1 exostosin family protein [Citreicella sp. C3M06]